MGKVFLVGAGPGDPDLLTVKALRILEAADAVVYDRPVSAEVRSLAAHAKQFDGGKRQGEPERIQDEINWLLVHHTRWEYLLRDGVEVEVVPGVSSAVAVPSLAGIPPTMQGVAASFAVIERRGPPRFARLEAAEVRA